ncbi:hypothetical protein [Polyangium aurulentum]|uniref:hypothetical protein n=1 Tax=Polyangium aurulentum TaxID=2567896 RepID=UPI0010ADDE54|nr:hypothetical protein [Polyangium aurulentum]UQA62111.1 hypothetical protein E8A73_017200 [Polyangium aurulentum]
MVARGVAGRGVRGWRRAVAVVTAGAGLVLFIASCEQPVNCAEDDHNACTVDKCVSGKPVHEKMPQGASCMVGAKQGVCSAGFCAVQCSSSATCNDGDACTIDQCQGGICVNALGNVPPDDGNVCTKELCLDGLPKRMPVLNGTPCGAGGECDDGLCTKCTSDAQCGTSSACEKFWCLQGTCVVTRADPGTPVPDPFKYDCKGRVCDGDGNLKIVAVENDLPPPSDTTCVQQTCQGWTPVFGPKLPGTKCLDSSGNVGSCNGSGACVECVTDNDCPVMGDYCFAGTCSRCDDGKQNGDETAVDCGGERCGDCLGAACTEASACKSGLCEDGVCCDLPCGLCTTCAASGSAGKCIPVPADHKDPSGCTAVNKACNGGGACKTKNGYACATKLECISNNCVNGVCVP